MSLTTADIQKALKIKKVVSEYFDNSTETTVMAKDLMKLFIAKGIFTKDHQEGFPIREFLRELEKDKNLKLIPQAHFLQKEQNKNWYFIKTNKQSL
ncbi:MAG: hypothetical protein ACOYMA_16895 [Bacteroidia bacterium]